MTPNGSVGSVWEDCGLHFSLPEGPNQQHSKYNPFDSEMPFDILLMHKYETFGLDR